MRGLQLDNDPIPWTSGYCPQEAVWKRTVWEARMSLGVIHGNLALPSQCLAAVIAPPDQESHMHLALQPQGLVSVLRSSWPLQQGHVLGRSAMYLTGVKIGWILIFLWGSERIADTWTLWSHGGDRDCYPASYFIEHICMAGQNMAGYWANSCLSNLNSQREKTQFFSTHIFWRKISLYWRS